MATLQEILNPDVAPQFVADCQALIDGEVDGKGGLSGTAEFGDYLVKRGEEVSEALLAVTDRMAGVSGRATIVKAYKMVRGSAGRNIEAALPNLGAMIQQYA